MADPLLADRRAEDLRLLDEIRQRMPRTAVVLMTADGTQEVVQGALQRGAYCVLTKPFDMAKSRRWRNTLTEPAGLTNLRSSPPAIRPMDVPEA